MRHGRQFLAAALAGPLALALVAADAPSTDPTGTASTSMSAVELAITTPAGEGALGLVDLETFASTAVDTALNPKGSPFASARLTPLTGPDGPVGESEARSDGNTSTTSGQAQLAEIGGPLADLGASVAPATMTATAAADEARAAVETLTAQIAGLAGALGVNVDVADVASTVTADRATAVQGLRVSQLDITLGDILPQDVLASLPLEDLLAFLEALPVELPADVTDVIEELRRTIETVTTQLGDVETTATTVEDQLEDLSRLNISLTALNTLLAQQQALLDVDLSDDTSGDTVTSIGETVDEAAATLIGTVDDTVDGIDLLATGGSCVDAEAIDTEQELQEASDCVGALIDAELAALDVTTVEELEQRIQELIEEITVTVDKLVRTIEELAPTLGAVATAAADLSDLLAALDGLLADAANTPIVDVSAFDIGVNAVSDGTVEGSDATVVCQPVTVTILTESVSTPSCEAGLTAVADASALVNGLLGTLTDTLNALPLAEVLTTGDLKVDLFTDLQHSVVEDGERVVATAGVTALDLEVPSITLDPGAPLGLLDGLDLPDVLGTVGGLLADLQAQIDALGLSELDPVAATLVSTTDSLDAEGGLGDLVAQLEAVIAGLDVGELGTLESVSTPSISLVIDPVSTASFQPAAEPKDPAGAPGGPSLPHTGGGLALLGLATMAGAVSLRRR